MKLPVTIVAALGLHAAAAAGAIALGHEHGTNTQSTFIVGNATIDVVTDEPQPVVKPVVEEERVATRVSTSVRESSRGAPSGVNVNVMARTSSSSAASPDALPLPPPVQTAEPVRFKMSASSGGASARDVPHSGVRAEVDEVAAEADVSERALKVGGVQPTYPPEAVAQGVELGSPLPFEIVVDSSGRVVSAHPLRRAGYGFDEAAAAALRTYRFSPAKRNGHAVAVRMKWTVDFRFN